MPLSTGLTLYRSSFYTETTYLQKEEADTLSASPTLALPAIKLIPCLERNKIYKVETHTKLSRFPDWLILLAAPMLHFNQIMVMGLFY